MHNQLQLSPYLQCRDYCYFKVYSQGESLKKLFTQATIKNTNISSATGVKYLIYVHACQFYLIGPIIFNNISISKSVIGLRTANITCSGNIEFVDINTDYILYYYNFKVLKSYFILFILENSTIKLTQSKVYSFALPERKFSMLKRWNQPCYFQYLSHRSLDEQYNYQNYSIMLSNNSKWTQQHAFKNLYLTHCW